MNIRDLFKKWRTPKDSYKYEDIIVISSNDDIPSNDLGKTMFLVQRDGTKRWLIMDCPGGHHKRIEVNLMKTKYPFWTLQIKDKKVSLSPSISVSDEKCDCHFWLRKNIAYKATFY